MCSCTLWPGFEHREFGVTSVQSTAELRLGLLLLDTMGDKDEGQSQLLSEEKTLDSVLRLTGNRKREPAASRTLLRRMCEDGSFPKLECATLPRCSK